MPIRRSILRLLLLGLLAQGLAGCQSDVGPMPVLPADPTAASQQSLEALYAEIRAALAATDPADARYGQLQRQLDTVGKELAERTAKEIQGSLDRLDRVEGLIPLTALEALRDDERLVAIEGYDARVHARLVGEIDDQIAETRRAIADQEQALESAGDDAILERLQIYASLAALHGEGSEAAARYEAQRVEGLAAVSQEAEAAIENEDYERAQGLLGIVTEIDPADEATRKQKCEVDGKVIVQRFSNALETGRVDDSIDMLEDFAETECFEEIKDGLAESAVPMVEAFGLLGQEATQAGDLELAYGRYRDARMIQTLLLDSNGDLPGIQSFLAKVDKAYQRAYEKGEYGLAWGYLSVMTEFGPTTPQMRQRIRMTKDEVARRAVRGMTAYPFADPPSSSTKVGDAVASKVVQHIFKTLPSDVRIVEREQLERILEECKRLGTCSTLDTADFIVQGSILDAKVETTEKVGSETRRVITGQETLTNVEHTRWTQMRERDRENTPEPPRTITRDVTEDVTIEVRSVRKVGIISVSYRVVEANSGRVLFTDSIQTKLEYQDEGRQGIQLGNFSQETDFVELPPDIEILSGSGGLADKISEEIGGKLVEFLQNPEDQYADEAKRFVQEGDFVGAARNAAYAIVLRERKSKEIGTLRDDMMAYSMASPAL